MEEQQHPIEDERAPAEETPAQAVVAEEPAPEEVSTAAVEPGEAAAEAAPVVENAPAAEAGAPEMSVDELLQLPANEEAPQPAPQEDTQLKAVLEAIIYVAEEPLTAAQMAAALHEPEDRIRAVLGQLMEEFEAVGHGVCIREIAGGFKMATKPEHHEAVRNFVKSLKPPLKLSLPALETLAVIAYKQPVTGPEIMEIRGVQGGGVLKTLLDRKLIAGAGRKNVIGKPILYKTTKEFLIQFGLKDLSELPSLKEFEEIRRMAMDTDPLPAPAAAPPEAPAQPAQEAAEPATEAAPEPGEAPGDTTAETEPEAPAEPTGEPGASQET